MSSEPRITILLAGNGRAFQPGDTLAGEYWVEGLDPDEVKAVEFSVLWHTEGKGEEDLGVVAFRRHENDHGWPFVSRLGEHFAAVLPEGPLSYDGWIVKIRWCVRVRVFPRHGRELVGAREFLLGEVRRPPGPELPTEQT